MNAPHVEEEGTPEQRAEMREIGRALGWAEDGASWAADGMGAPLAHEHAALLAAPEAT